MKYFICLFALFAILFVLAPPANADTYTISGSSILKNGTPWEWRGANSFQIFGGSCSDMTAWNMDIVRQPVFEIDYAPVNTGVVQAPDGSYLHGIQDVVNDDRANGKVTIIDPHTWSTGGFTGQYPRSTSWWNGYLTILQQWAVQFKNQPDVWIEVWNEPYDGNVTDAQWLSDMQTMVDNIRGQGNNNIILVPGKGWDQDETVINRMGSTLLQGRSNILFDVHAYENWLYNNTEAQMESRINAVKTVGAVVFGEFGPQNNTDIMDTRPFITALGNTHTTATAWSWKCQTSDLDSLKQDDCVTPNDAGNNVFGSSVKAWTMAAHGSLGGGGGPVSINSGGPAASPFATDTNFSGGTAATNWTGAIDTTAAANPAPQAVYQSERWGPNTYTISGLAPSTNYTVRLHFCENLFTASGLREFNVAINGTSELTNFDIYATAGAIHKAVTKQYTITANASGQMVIAYTNGAVNNALSSGVEVLVPAIPTVPTGVTATAGNMQVALIWNASTGATSYNVKRSTVSGSGYVTVSSPTVTNYTNTGLTNGTTYYFVVSAVNGTGESANSSQVSAKPLPPIPAAPAGLTATPGNAQVALSWTASSGATSYNVKRSTVSGSGYVTVSSPTTTSYTNTGLTNGTTYYFVVTAVNLGGESGNSAQVSAKPSAGVTLPIQINAGGPAVSPFVADIDFSGGAAATNWTGAITTTGVTNPAPQAVYQSERYGNSTYTIPGLISGTSYTARLHFCENYNSGSGQRTFNVSINSTQVLTNFDIYATTGAQHKATVQQFTTSANTSGQIVIVLTTVLGNALINGVEITALAPPAAPTGLAATPGNTQVALSWSASFGATSYNVKRSTVSGSGYATVSSPTTTSYTNTGLANGTTYYYVVTAVNAGGESANSSQVPATPVLSITFKQVAWAAPTSSSTPVSVTFGSAQTIGNLNIVVAGWNDTTSTVTSVTDSAGNTYTRAIGPTALAGLGTQSLYYASNIHAGSNTVTVTFSGTVPYPDVRILEYAGVSTLDKTAAATGNSATSNSGSAATTTANELIFGANYVAGLTSGPGTGFTSRAITSPDGNIAEDEVVSSIGGYSATAANSSGGWIMQMATFK